jgi:glutamate racemase
MIGVFDSGSGGLTVLKAIRERAPDADIVYFGDLKNAPYGNKSREELGALTVLGIQKLIDEGATEIVSACNSVSVSIVLPMFETLDIPRTSLIEMVGPTVASQKGVASRGLVAATRATVDSGVYQNEFGKLGIVADGLAIPELVAAIESGADTECVEGVIAQALEPVALGEYSHLVLGCTHFPHVQHVFADVVNASGASVTIVDPAEAVANEVVKRFATDGYGRTRFLVSRESEVFAGFVDMCVPGERPNITLV